MTESQYQVESTSASRAYASYADIILEGLNLQDGEEDANRRRPQINCKADAIPDESTDTEEFVNEDTA